MKTIESERAEKLRRGKLLLKLHQNLIFVKLEDEGDRVYLRSTNDAETLKAIIAEIDEYGWQEFMREKNEPDIFETCREAVKALEVANATIADLQAELANCGAGKGVRADQIEVAARAMYEFEPWEDGATWETMPPANAESFRETMRFVFAALAALPVTGGE